MHTDVEKIKKYVRAANYLSVTQIYLQDNFLLERPLTIDDIKPKLFGHWGTCPGINFVYGHLNYLVKKHKQSTIFVLGPGHGVPALHSNLFLEGTMAKYHKQASLTPEGLAWVSKSFAWPYVLSSHTSPDTPGQILEGGELGYSLATAYGAILDNPDLLAVCMIGDGEAETGALAAAWHINKLIDPQTNGAVLPILHVNGLKISGPTIFGRMSDEELISLFTGYGYEPHIVSGSGDEVYEQMFETLETCYQKIKELQSNPLNPPYQGETSSLTREGRGGLTPRFPMIILKTPKGWTTVKEINGKAIEGTIASHQVVAANARGDEAELKAVEDWLKSYKFDELFDKTKGFSQDILDIIPEDRLRIGDNPHVFGEKFQELIHPDPKKLEKNVEQPGEIQSNSMRMAGTYLTEVFRLNKEQKNFRLMSPDETYSNRLDEVFKETARAFVWPVEKMDKDISRDGRVMEMLSEHNMHGLAQGYVLTGRHTVFTTYEAFAQIISSMGHMYQKFLKYVRTLPWRRDISSMNYLLTSVAWRQEHNGYSHQNPSFITSMLEKQNDFVKVYFPADDNSMLAVMEETLSAKNQMNTVVAGKTPEPRWLTYEQAKKSLQDGLLTWDFASDANPDIVLVGIGDYLTKEAMAAIELLKKETPEIKIRFVNIIRLQAQCTCPDAYHPQLPNAESYFTEDKPVIVNFHGYPEVMKAMLFDVKNPHRFSVHGYQEQGGTTTPFDMQVRNRTDRYHLAMEVLQKMKANNVVAKEKAEKVIQKFEKALAGHYAYITRVGADPIEIENWQWSAKSPIIADVDEVMQANLLKEAKTIAVIGLSDNPERHSHRVAKYFQEKGFKIIPVNPNQTEVLGEKSYPSLTAIPKDIHIDIVDIFRKPEEVVPHLKEVVERGGIRSVWLQEGVSSQEAEDFAEDYGLTMVTNFCIMEAYKKLEK